jgi:predicted O-methyltransferase YrrM
MNAILESILETESVSDGTRLLPLRHPDFPQLPVHVDRVEGAFLQTIISELRPTTTLEIGLAYGVSTLYICEALSALDLPARHIVIDPFQRTQWKGIGLRNVTAAGFGPMIEFHEEFSELELPRLVACGEVIDFAFVDGWHTFDQVMVEFYYLNRLLRVGGVIVFDDANRRSVNRSIRHALTYPAYRVQGTAAPQPAGVSFAGRARRAIASLPGAARVIRADVIHRDWDLGILGSCVAIIKTAEDKRSSGWDQPF